MSAAQTRRVRQVSLRVTHGPFSSLPCDSSPSANIIRGATARAHDHPILVVRAEFRAERERRRRSFEAAALSLHHREPCVYVRSSRIWALYGRSRDKAWCSELALCIHFYLLPSHLAKTT
ncbi:hypothetical protein Q5P01_013170 [Channa striata]|uniref:Uncharacterized protein n=1 Tax=Channa striata TaxID=64152 RepID=A0AA88SN18_CHASR|nr:hypothetical protein Q5P01_013170 [Channa striata]